MDLEEVIIITEVDSEGEEAVEEVKEVGEEVDILIEIMITIILKKNPLKNTTAMVLLMEIIIITMETITSKKVIIIIITIKVKVTETWMGEALIRNSDLLILKNLIMIIEESEVF